MFNSLDDVYTAMCEFSKVEHDPSAAKANLRELKRMLKGLSDYDLAFVCLCGGEKQNVDRMIQYVKMNRE